MSFRRELASYIKEKYSEEVSEHDSLFDRGLIDSMGLLDIISFIENQTGVVVPDDDVAPENFETIAVIDDLVERLRGSGT